MIALAVEPEPRRSDPEPDRPPRERGEPDLSVLEDRVPDGAKLSRRTALLTLFTGLLFAVLSYQPLWHTDLWGHLAYGRWIWSHQALPVTEPLLPLCEGVPFRDPAWLTQIFGFLAMRTFDVASLQFAYAAAITACCVLLARMVLRRAASTFWPIAAMVAFGAIGYQQLIVVRPQLAGLVCFVATFSILTATTWRRAYWFVLPALFALWANLHGSFLMGLVLIGCFVAGRGFDVWRRTGRLKALWKDDTFRRHALVLELCAAAVLLNPYGLGLFVEVFKVAANRNLQDLIEWDPLTLRMMQGRTAAAAALALMVVYRFTPRRISGSEVLALVVFGLAACWTSRILNWWAPLAAYFLALHGAAIARQRGWTSAIASPRSGLWTVATIGLVWISFAYTPFGVRLVHGGPRTEAEAERRFRRAVSAQTPIDAANFLRAHPPQGLVFNTYEWGDYLLWGGPPGIECFVASHAHLVPREVWEDYLWISSAGTDWDRRLARYGVNTVVVDQAERKSLIRALKDNKDDWSLEYEDGLAVIFQRKKAIP